MTTTYRGIFRALIVLAVAMVALPSGADAQVWKRARDAAAQRAAERAVDAAARKAEGDAPSAPASGASGGAASAASPKASSTMLEITSERIDQLIAAVTPHVQAIERHAAAKAAEEKYMACRAQVMQNPAAWGTPTAADERVGEAARDASQKLVEQMIQAQQRGDTALTRMLSDSVQVLSEIAMAATAPALKRCGARPVPAGDAPAPVISTASQQQFNRTQFGILRERVAAFVLTNGAFGAEYKSEYMAFTPNETATLKARLGDLQPLKSYFAGNSARWTSWWDLTDW